MPKVSVVILNWNGKKFLNDCFASIKKLTHKPLEVILIDQNSSDGSAQYVRKNFPWVRLIASKINNGFAGGNNIGAKAATGKYVLFLNNDTELTPDLLRILVGDMENDSSIGCLQPQMRVMGNKELLDEAGAYLTSSGFLYHYGYRKPYLLPMYQARREIYSAKGACMLIPRKIFQEVGAFDEDFFIFFEETDLCHRIWLAGYRVLYQPKANIFHTAGGDTTKTYDYEKRLYLTSKNMFCSYLKNFGFFFMVTVFPIFLVTQMSLLVYFLSSFRISVVKSMLRGYRWNIINLGRTLKKRATIQRKLRKISDRQLMKHIFYNPKFYYYYCLLFDAKRYRDEALPFVT